MHSTITPASLNSDPIAIHTQPISRLFWADFVRGYLFSHYSHVGAVISVGDRNLPELPAFAAEVFHRLYYEFEPQFLQPVAPERKWAEALHNTLSSSDDLAAIASRAQGNPLAAGLATCDVLNRLIDTLPRPQAPINDLASLREQAKEAIRNGQTEAAQQLQEKGKAAAQAAIAYAEQLEDSQEELGQVIAAAADQAAETLETAQEEFEMLGLGWGNEPGSDTQLPLAERLELAGKLSGSKQLKEILELAGKFRDVALVKRRKAKAEAGYGEIVGVTTGAELGRLLPMELAKLANAATKPLFYKAYTERSLLEYEMQAPEPLGKGPMVICIDVSSSMSGNAEVWAKGLAIAMIRLAHEDNRDAAVILFSDTARRPILLKAREKNHSQLVKDVAGFWCGGGTDFHSPLQSALKVINGYPEFKKAEIVFITDGMAPVYKQFRAEFMKAKDSLDFSLFTLELGSYCPPSSLKELSDETYRITDLHSPGDVQELFTKL